MKTSANAVQNREPLSPLEQLDLEAQARMTAAIAKLDQEFLQEFGAQRSRSLKIEAGPEPWDDFLDLATL